MNQRCVVVFPLYKSPNAEELAFLENGLEKLSDFKAVLVVPESLRIDDKFGKLKDLEQKRFPEEYFKGIGGYNRLMLSETFYRTFNHFDYVLIHQADVWIFKNDLKDWCNKGYAYIGSPWFKPRESWFKQAFSNLKRTFNKNYGKKHNRVGNGGFSLRHVSRSLRVLSAAPDEVIDFYLNSSHHSYNEDVFWSLKAPEILVDFSIPALDEALHFGIEFNPEEAFIRIGGLPFGCHAPLVHGRKFWQKFIPF